MDSIKKLQELFRKFPTIGSRTAGRFVFYLINQPQQTTDELIQAIQELKKNVKLCESCFNPFEPFDTAQGKSGEMSETSHFCDICQSPSRDKQLLCIVEKEADLHSLEKTKKFHGVYFVLGNPLRLVELKKRIQASQFTEVIIALNSTPEGRASTVLVVRTLKELPQFSTFKITRLGQGLPVGGELEYADEETLDSAFEGRK